MMKIVDKIIPTKFGEVALSKISIEYIQELDCCQSEDDHPDECQILTISTDDGGAGKFLRLKTGEAGWSIDKDEDLIEIISDFRKRSHCD